MSLRNPRYERFAYGLAEGKPAYQAYIDAGFAKAGAAQSASRLLKSQRAGIRERVAEILQEREQIDVAGSKLAIERIAIDKEWVIERLRENVERAMQAQPVIDRAGNPTGAERGTPLLHHPANRRDLLPSIIRAVVGCTQDIDIRGQSC